MDKLKGMAEKAMHSGSSSSTKTGNTNTAGGQPDYVDKGLTDLEKRTGHAQSASTNEKITDKARELYEKQTGKPVNSKISN